ncbi:MAG: hypothetical protein ABXS91_10775, partial [Sulfurimonas sp.]
MEIVLKKDGKRVANLGNFDGTAYKGVSDEVLDLKFMDLKEDLMKTFMGLLLIKKLDNTEYEDANVTINALSDDIEDLMGQITELGRLYVLAMLEEEDGLELEEVY